MNKGTLGGIVAALGISVTAAIALPLVNVFKTMTPGELMIVRGTVGAALIATFFSKRVTRVSGSVFAFSLLFAMANFCLYSGIRAWGANPTVIILTATPVTNIAAKWWRGHGVEPRVALSLTVLLMGVFVARNPWEATFNIQGFMWSITATLLAGIGYEILGTAKDIDPYHKSFWVAALMIAVGLIATALTGRVPFSETVWSAWYVIALLGYGFAGGFLYILANVVAFEKLKTEVASVLAMGETPAVILGAWLTLGEYLSPLQWLGVIIALVATLGLSASEATKRDLIDEVA